MGLWDTGVGGEGDIKMNTKKYGMDWICVTHVKVQQ